MSQTPSPNAPPFPPELVEGASGALRAMLALLPPFGSMAGPYMPISLSRTLFLRDADVIITVQARSLMPWEMSTRAAALASESRRAEDVIRDIAGAQQTIRKDRS